MSKKNEGGRIPLQDVFDFSGTEDVLLTPEHVSAMTGLNVRRLKAMALAGDFPAFVRIGYRTLRYWRGEVVEWLRCRKEGRRWQPKAKGGDEPQKGKP